MMQLFFRVEGNEQLGLGHLMRCFALSQAAHQANIKVIFICNQASKSFLLTRHQWRGDIVVIDDTNWNKACADDAVSIRNKKEIDFIVTCLSRFSSQDITKDQQILVLDGYQFDHSYQQSLSKADICFAYLDDINTFLHQSKNHLANVVINGAAVAPQLGYEKNTPNSRLCLGSQYLLLRSEFTNLPLISIANRHSLLIFFGGADAQNHTIRMLCALSQLTFTHPVQVVTGAAYKFQEQLSENIQNGWLICNKLKQQITMPIHYTHDSQDMADIMLHSRLSISAAGGAQFELMRCYTPSFLVVVADNQMPAAEESAQQGWCYSVDGRHQVDYIGLAKRVYDDYDKTESLTAMQQKAYQCTQKEICSGANNVIDVFNEFISVDRR
jgi:UDP-2,4-diacetamido-2,4,6-trideoxy-beta-L-altropyranose hydrolase